MIQTAALIELLKDSLADPLLEVVIDIEDVKTATKYIRLHRTGGSGLDTESLLDRVAFQVESVGEQYNHASAETLAHRVDRIFLTMQAGKVGGVKVFSVDRRGDPPSLLRRDDAHRYHFVATYELYVQSVLTA